MHSGVGIEWCFFFFFQAEDGIRDLVRSRGLGDVYKRQFHSVLAHAGANPCSTRECHRHGMASCFEAAARVLTAALRGDDICDSVRTHSRYLGAHASPRHARGLSLIHISEPTRPY